MNYTARSFIFSFLIFIIVLGFSLADGINNVLILDRSFFGFAVPRDLQQRSVFRLLFQLLHLCDAGPVFHYGVVRHQDHQRQNCPARPQF